jgi:hypothetical protein
MSGSPVGLAGHYGEAGGVHRNNAGHCVRLITFAEWLNTAHEDLVRHEAAGAEHFLPP